MSEGNSSTNCSVTTSDTDGNYANIVLSVVVSLTAVMSVLSNFLVIASVAKTPNLQTPANLMLCSLSLSDLLTGLVVMPLFLTSRLFFLNISVSRCVYRRVLATYTVAFFTCSGASFTQLCLLSWDRYKAVSSPLVYRADASKGRTLKTIVASWLAWTTWNGIMIAAIPRPTRDYILFVITSAFVVFPSGVQVATLKAVRRHNREIVATDSQAIAATALAREKKVLTTLRFVLVALLFSLAAPLVLHGVTMASEEPVEYAEQDNTAWGNVFVFLNSCVNPIIYFLRHPDMRTAAFRLIGH